MNIIRIIKDPRLILGLLFSICGIYWAFKDFNFTSFIITIKQIDYLYLILAAIFLWLSVFIRGIRWKYLFSSDNSPSIFFLYKAEMIGYFGNNILPLRLGEFLRSYIVGKEYSIPKSYVFGTVISERLLDMLSLAFLGFIMLISYPLQSFIKEKIFFICFISCLIILIMYLLLFKFKNYIHKNKITDIIYKVFDGILSIRRDYLFRIVLSSALIWLIYLLDVYFMQKAFQFNLSWNQILTILVISSMALSIPSAPGMIGTFHAAIKFTMVDLFSYTINDGNSFAILMHAYGYILLTLLGAYYFLSSQFHNNALKSIIK